MLPKKSLNTSNSTPNGVTKKTASALNVIAIAGVQTLAILFALAGLLFLWHDDTLKVRVGTIGIQAEVANTPEERLKGLSHKAHLAADRGMLFVFPYEAQWSMWMKDMDLPLDIVWLDAHKKVIAVAANADPRSYPYRFTPPQNALYVLELASGVAARAHIEPGVMAQFDVSPVTK